MQLGYKLRKHIGNALKAQSKAIRTTLQNYNVATQALVPPRPALSWDDVVEYAFLADFDLLTDTRSDVRLRVWAKPASHVLMDQFFKMERAQEEIAWLNVEIPCVTTFIRDEEAYLLQQEEILSESNPPLSHQLHMRRLKLIWTNDLHFRRFNKLATMSGFSGTIEPGTTIEAAALYLAENTAHNESHNREAAEELAGRDEEGEEDEDEHVGVEVTDAFCLVIEGPR